MMRRSALRASDSDREWVAERLRNATAEGRLVAEELEERLGAAFSARTYGELDALVADLPAPRNARRRDRGALWVRGVLALAGLLTLLAAVAVAAFVIAGLLATWVLWVALGWLFFGRLGGAECSHRVGSSRGARARRPRSSPFVGRQRGGD